MGAQSSTETVHDEKSQPNFPLLGKRGFETHQNTAKNCLLKKTKNLKTLRLNPKSLKKRSKKVLRKLPVTASEYLFREKDQVEIMSNLLIVQNMKLKQFFMVLENNLKNEPELMNEIGSLIREIEN